MVGGKRKRVVCVCVCVGEREGEGGSADLAEVNGRWFMVLNCHDGVW